MTAPGLDQRFADAMGQLLGPDFPSDIALAVSGGGDSMAMLTLAHNWTRTWGVRLHIVTIDHGLRPGSAEEATLVAEEAAALGWPHSTLRWHWDGQGNKMDAARRARLALIDGWRGAMGHVLMAHTRDDVAETFLMRLARGSGIEGLSAMTDRRWVRSVAPAADGSRGPDNGAGYTILRPCLDMGRAELRHYLTTLRGRFADDPSNTDPAYDRSRVRQALAPLSALGIDTAAMAETALRLRRSRAALFARAAQVWTGIGHEGTVSGVPTGEVILNRDGFAVIERDTQMRLLSAALRYVSGADYAPRASALEALLDRLLGGRGGTLHGCDVLADAEALIVTREWNAVRDLVGMARHDTLWDGRWRVSDPGFRKPEDGASRAAGPEVRALGDDGWQALPADKRETGLPLRRARALPALWDGQDLLACDAKLFGPVATTDYRPMGAPDLDFHRFLLAS